MSSEVLKTYMKGPSSKLPTALILSPLAEQPVLSTKYLSSAATYRWNTYLLIMRKASINRTKQDILL
jgi:hypothetical protein